MKLGDSATVKLWRPSYALLVKLAARMTIESGKVTLSEALESAIEQALLLYEPVHVGDLPDADISPQGQASTKLTPKAYKQLQRVIAHRMLADDNPHSISETCHAIIAHALSKYEPQ